MADDDGAYVIACRILREEIARREHESYWRGVMVGVALGIPATVTAVWLSTGVRLLLWWL